MAVIRHGESLFFPIKSGVKMVPDKATDKQKKLYFAVGARMGYNATDLEEEAKSIYKLVRFDDISGTEMSELNKRLLDKWRENKEREKGFGNAVHVHKWECKDCGDRLYVNLTLVKAV